jgi:hypothetical protein
MRSEQRQRAVDEPGQHVVVGRVQIHAVAARRRDADIERAKEADRRLEANEPDARITSPRGLHDTRRAVGGRVVHDEDLVRPRRCGKEGVERVPEIVAVIPCRNDHGQRWTGHLGGDDE